MIDDINWNDPKIRHNFVENKSPHEPAIDEPVSQVLGFKVYMRDPRLINLVVAWKKKLNKSSDNREPDNFLQNPKFLEELREVFKKPL